MTEAVTEVVVLALQWEIRVLRYELVGRVWAAALATCVAAATSHPCHPFVVLIVLVVVLVVLVVVLGASVCVQTSSAYADIDFQKTEAMTQASCEHRETDRDRDRQRQGVETGTVMDTRTHACIHTYTPNMCAVAPLHPRFALQTRRVLHILDGIGQQSPQPLLCTPCVPEPCRESQRALLPLTAVILFSLPLSPPLLPSRCLCACVMHLLIHGLQR